LDDKDFLDADFDEIDDPVKDCIDIIKCLRSDISAIKNSLADK
jgi:hypothetical protein